MTVSADARSFSPQELWDIAARVNDPEIPVLSIADLGILRSVEIIPEGEQVTAGEPGAQVKVTITPTYSGCPAMDAIAADVKGEFARAGLGAAVVLNLSPAWTTDWMSEAGKAKLEEYGIAPPTHRSDAGPVRLALGVKCPRCQSLNTRELTRFGSTSCKALYQCRECQEPFDYFKVH
ncbi:1,2-phenylacetyl-CoA epoxidase subunit PaaD [Haematomicrobium sanguinis]|uniref:1,2-phenylacetyl-CoA epoxidase subunit PaaD n=1 Tax=Haematomicrobium sanguinis TaxID=479106 RepID=UPI00047D8552|nr:1,2-phenylacetyl-CoA epoxidase subunit PaaD [Haematomicrobium sanguinis]